jgi:hypothetical protein
MSRPNRHAEDFASLPIRWIVVPAALCASALLLVWAAALPAWRDGMPGAAAVEAGAPAYHAA